MPLIWTLSYFNVFGELFLNAGAALDAMNAAGAIDRCGTGAPCSGVDCRSTHMWCGNCSMGICGPGVLTRALLGCSHAVRRNVTLAPVTLGMDVPAWYQPLLEPYTRHKVRRLPCKPDAVLLAPAVEAACVCGWQMLSIAAMPGAAGPTSCRLPWHLPPNHAPER